MRLPETEVTISQDGEAIARHVLLPGEYIIGREAGVDLPLAVPLVSRRHAKLTINPTELIIEDLHSSNGTLLNGRKLSAGVPARIFPPETIQISSATITLRRLPTVSDSDPSPGSIGEAPGEPSTIPGGLLFGRYRLQRELGRGGMGVVLLAEDEELGIPVAIKMVPELVVLDRQGIDELKREVLRGRALLHPGIVRTHNFARDGNSAAIVMEYVDGDNLANMKMRQPCGCFDFAEVLPWLGQICAVLSYAHQDAHIAHRDLKPANVMLTSDGKIKVADFGISSNLSDTLSRISLQGDISGTPAYMSPQQIMGRQASRLDDIYALGATIYDLLTGKPPFYQGEIFAQTIDSTAPPMTERRLELGVAGKVPIPPEWEKAICACLEKKPENRPQSAGEVLALLRGKALPPPIGNERTGDGAKVPEVMETSPASADSVAMGRSLKARIGVAIVTTSLIAIGILGFKGGLRDTADSTDESGVATADFTPDPTASTPGETRALPDPNSALPEAPSFTRLTDGVHVSPATPNQTTRSAPVTPNRPLPEPRPATQSLKGFQASPATTAQVPQSFRYNYPFDNPGYRVWTRIDDIWEEKSPEGTVKVFQTVGRGTIDGRPGSIIRLRDTAAFEVFVSDKQVSEPRIYFRRDEGKWTWLGKMEDLK